MFYLYLLTRMQFSVKQNFDTFGKCAFYFSCLGLDESYSDALHCISAKYEAAVG